MGSSEGFPDEAPQAVVTIDRPFWMGVVEITNGQYAQYDRFHDTRYIDEHGKDHAAPGFIANHRRQPVARVSWQEAMGFCRWLSSTTGAAITLPTEAQWEWAARAGTGTQFFYGTADTDFSPYANLADRSLHFTRSGYPGGSRLRRAHPYDNMLNYPLRDNRFNDGSLVSNYAGEYQANPWGLKDIIGNVSEWTRSDYLPYPYKASAGRTSCDVKKKKVARGGSWYDRPVTAGASVRFPYDSYQKVHNVGFRVIVEKW
jgi:formylglycine-generating enzyme required for sulfatase activity